MTRHADFEKIYQQFQIRYGEDGEKNYLAWLSLMGLDESKPYTNETQFGESFGWAHTLITRLKEEDGRRLYKVDAAFPLSSMNQNVYTEDELIQATRMLQLVKSNLNHSDLELPFTNKGAQYEDGAAEILMSVPVDAVSPMGYKYVDMLERSADVPEDLHIIHVSIEGGCRDSELTDEGFSCIGLGYTGIAYLTKKVLPGIPLTRIVPVERIVESFSPPKGVDTMKKEIETTEPEEMEEQDGTRSDAARAKAHFGISDEEWDKLSDKKKQAYIDKLPPRGQGGEAREQELTLADLDAKLDRIIGLLSEEEKLETPEEQEEPSPEPEPVCGDCSHYIDGKCELDDSEKAADSECDKGQFSPKGEPSEPPAESISEPFADYDDFDDCVAKNQDKEDPEAYCAAIKKKAEDEPKEASVEQTEKDAEEPEEAKGGKEAAPEPKVPTKFDFVKRYKTLKEEGLSSRDAWRRAGFEFIERLQK